LQIILPEHFPVESIINSLLMMEKSWALFFKMYLLPGSHFKPIFMGRILETSCYYNGFDHSGRSDLTQI